jgi:hypothetical protein
MGDSSGLLVRSDWRTKARFFLTFRAAACVAVFAAAAGLWVGVQVYAQAPVAKTMLMEPPTPLLPATLGKLKRVAEGDSGDGLGQLDTADAPVLKEDGLRRFVRSEYVEGPQHGTVTVYKFVDASGAISAFDYFRKPGMGPFVKLGDQVAYGGDDILFRSGVNVVRASFNLHHDSVSVLMNELNEHLPKVGGTAALAPLLPTLLPAKGLDADSVKYALGPEGYRAMGGVLPAQAVGFDKSAEAVTAKYKSGGVLTVLLYPTPQIAGEHARLVEAQTKQGEASAGMVKIRREGPLVALTTGSWTAGDAQKMVDGIHLRSEVSFDKPMPLEFHAEVQKTYSLLTSIAAFCGLGALAAVVLGLFLGGGRAAIRVMQGKPAASEPEFLRIDLRGSVGKRLRGPEA